MANSSTGGSAGAAPPRWAVRLFTRLHVLLSRASGGRLLNSIGGDEICFLTMKGAKSGRSSTIPLMYVPHRDGVLLVASLGGAPKHPVWYYNVVAHPDITVTHRGRAMRLRARLATPAEKPALWPICDQHYAPYADYRKRTSRDIPIFVCEPAPTA